MPASGCQWRGRAVIGGGKRQRDGDCWEEETVGLGQFSHRLLKRPEPT
jgi:hypothetical protein